MTIVGREPDEGLGTTGGALDARAVRSVGVEEEFLLLDPVTGRLVPGAGDVLAAARPRLPGWSGREPGDPGVAPEVTHEFFQEQIEVSTPPCLTTTDLERHLRRGRSACAEAAEAAGVVLAAMPVPVLPHEEGAVTPRPRFRAIRETYGELAAQGLTCGLHVHVQTAGPAEAVGILDRMQAWLPVLLAVSANSPYWRGVDTGYASWRSRLWEMWPTSGPTDVFGSTEEHDAVVERLVAWGSASDVAMLNFGARRSAIHPTVEVRITDACTDLADVVLLAAVVRALATTAAAEWEAGAPPLPWRAEELRAAGWLAARHGTARSLVDPVERRARPAGDVLGSLLSHVDRALTESGDRTTVAAGLARVADRGTGADAQRRELGRSGTLRDVALDLARRTLAP